MSQLWTVTLPAASGFAEDNVVNTFAVKADGPHSESTLAQTENHLVAVYNSFTSPASAAVGTYISPSITRSQPCVTRCYILDTPGKLAGTTPLGSPVYEDTFTLVSPGGTAGLPQEVALVATLHGENRDEAAVETSAGTRPKQRRTGRIYFGPFTTAGLGGSTPYRPSDGMQLTIRNAIKNWAQAMEAHLGLGQGAGVWSRADATVYPLAGVSTDNAWDTQRRRGVAPTIRTLLDVSDTVSP
jgi:hypothetical protein